MLLKTHLAFAVLIIILFIQKINHPFIFITMALIATILPDLDCNFSSWGRHLIFRPLQFFVKHRGMIHSLTFAIAISVLLSIFWPIGVLGFFIGYSAHIVLDSFTKDGIQLFWPLTLKTKGFILSGGRLEDSIFVFFILIDVLIIILLFAF